ncbi:PVC-type heme-binding CxxCH protein [Spirosoma lituiforme]
MLLLSAYQRTGPSKSFLSRYFSQLNDADKHDPRNGVASLSVAQGLEAALFAAEPMLTNPTNIDVDTRGRVWVCEAYNYRPAITGNATRKEGDRIVILEDTDKDGKADVSKTFYQDPSIESPLGIWVQGNQVIVSDSPNVWVLTDDDGDDKADRKELLFTGIGGEQHDHGMHTFVFGPDGKWYFNFGNEGGQLKDKTGKPVIDVATNKVINKQNFRQGIVFRCDPGGTNVEVLGQNFRNNYEVAVDSYGSLWQSDNDDDGNRSTRINYVMEYGNYGYTDEMTGAGWQANRTNLETEIPSRHWHLNDPGVVPNLLQTGAGSPTGLVVYEGQLLPEVFRNQIIHCDAGPNVVRSYPVQNDGAGYKARIVNILEGVRDQWFRPADVCVAPDGSLIVADWYDPAVGGHQVGDLNKGRIYRVAPPKTPYTIPIVEVASVEGALAALQSPNMDVRYSGWQALHNLGAKAEKPLAKFYKHSTDSRQKARALWLLSKLPNGKGQRYITEALTDNDPNLRITALRAARQMSAAITLSAVKHLLNDQSGRSNDVQVRRECAIALRHATSPEAPGLWARLATLHDGTDRWYLEALGIGADGNWDTYFPTYLKQLQNSPLTTAGGRDIVWRARTAAAVPILATLAGDDSQPLSSRLRYFRAFDFNPGREAKSQALLNLITSHDNEVARLVLNHLDPAFVKNNPSASSALTKLMDQAYGTTEYLELVARYEPTTENLRLHQLALAKPYESLGQQAARQLLTLNGAKLLWQTINGPDVDAAKAALTSIRTIGSKVSLDMLSDVALDKRRAPALRKEAIRFLGGSEKGEDLVIALLKSGQIKGDYKAVAVQGVAGAWRRSIRTEAAGFLDGGTTALTGKMPAMTDLLALNGEATRGLTVYKNNCSICHMVGETGMDFGPKLTEIGSKLPKEGLYLAILYPDAGISFGYEGWEVAFKDGSSMTGIVSSRTETDLQMKFPGGLTQSYKMADVKTIKPLDGSLMPSGLHEAMSARDLADLASYLTTLTTTK